MDLKNSYSLVSLPELSCCDGSVPSMCMQGAHSQSYENAAHSDLMMIVAVIWIWSVSLISICYTLDHWGGSIMKLYSLGEMEPSERSLDH